MRSTAQEIHVAVSKDKTQSDIQELDEKSLKVMDMDAKDPKTGRQLLLLRIIAMTKYRLIP